MKDDAPSDYPGHTPCHYCGISKRRIILSCILLLIGSSIYILFRQDAIFISWIDADLLSSIRIDKSIFNGTIASYLILYCAPDALWYAALITLQIPFYHYGGIHRTIAIICFSLPFALELMQFAGILNGTFDLWDMTTYIITLTIISLCERKR